MSTTATNTNLGDGEIQPDVNDDKDEEKVEGADDQQWLLQQHVLWEDIMKLQHTNGTAVSGSTNRSTPNS